MQVVGFHDVPRLGYPAQAVVDVAAHRVHLGAVDAGAKDLLHVFRGYPGVHQHLAVVLMNHLGVPGAGELVLDLADDLFQHVLHGDQALGAAVFIHHDGDLGAALLQFFQQVVYPLGLGDDERFTHQTAQGILGPGCCQRSENVAGVDDSQDPVYGFFVNRQAAVARAHHRFSHDFKGRVSLHGGHVQPGHHDLSNGGGVQTYDGTEHLPVPVIKARQLFLGDGWFFKLSRRHAVCLAAVSVAICRLAVHSQRRSGPKLAVGRTNTGPRPGQSRVTFAQERRRPVDQE